MARDHDFLARLGKRDEFGQAGLGFVNVEYWHG
jgi:hypothetical protein